MRLEFDITDPDSRARLFEFLDATKRNLSGLVNLYGNPILFQNITELDWGILSNLLNKEIGAAFDLIKEAAKRMKELGGGAIVQLSSTAAENYQSTEWAAYQLTKQLLNNLTLLSAAEYGKHNIRVNAVSPAFLKQIFRRISHRLYLQQANSSALKREIEVGKL